MQADHAYKKGQHSNECNKRKVGGEGRSRPSKGRTTVGTEYLSIRWFPSCETACAASSDSDTARSACTARSGACA
eukprot:6470895-Amphidinium_carterae.1